MKILCEASTRHVHISQEHLEALFGKDATMEAVKPLSQPGQYLSEKRVDFVTEKTVMKNVAVLGPPRPKTQIEISRTDAFILGLKNVPVRQSGELEGTPGITLQNGDKRVTIDSGVIIALRHVHLDPVTADKFNIKDNQIVSIEIEGERGGILTNAVVRVNPDFAPAIHIDTDEANGLGFTVGEARIIV